MNISEQGKKVNLRIRGAGDFKSADVSGFIDLIRFLFAIGVIIGVGFFISGPGLISCFCGVLHNFLPSGGTIQIFGT